MERVVLLISEFCAHCKSADGREVGAFTGFRDA